jgi:hypothetical protein
MDWCKGCSDELRDRLYDYNIAIKILQESPLSIEEQFVVRGGDFHQDLQEHINNRAVLVAKDRAILAKKTGEILKAIFAKIHVKVFDIDDMQREIVKYLPMLDMKQLITVTELIVVTNELEGEGFYIQNVAADGNCFFHALALQLPGLTHEDLRAITISKYLVTRKIIGISLTKIK